MFFKCYVQIIFDNICHVLIHACDSDYIDISKCTYSTCNQNMETLASFSNTSSLQRIIAIMHSLSFDPTI